MVEGLSMGYEFISHTIARPTQSPEYIVTDDIQVQACKNETLPKYDFFAE